MFCELLMTPGICSHDVALPKDNEDYFKALTPRYDPFQPMQGEKISPAEGTYQEIVIPIEDELSC